MSVPEEVECLKRLLKDELVASAERERLLTEHLKANSAKLDEICTFVDRVIYDNRRNPDRLWVAEAVRGILNRCATHHVDRAWIESDAKRSLEAK
jgi:hypothetical protein